jgi:hypothetical protein
MVGHPDDTETHQATNHIRFAHLQGDPAGDGFGAGYLQTYSRLSRIDIDFPNVELADDQPGFVLSNDSNPSTHYNIRGAALTGGDPAFDVGGNQYQFVGGHILASDGAITDSSGVAKVSVAGMELTTGSGNVVGLDNSRLAMSGCKVRGGTNGLRLSNAGSTAVSGTYFIGAANAAIKFVNANASANRGTIVGGVAIWNAASEGEQPIVIENSDNVHVSGATVVGNETAADAAVSVVDSQNVGLDSIHTVLPRLVTQENATLAETSPRA